MKRKIIIIALTLSILIVTLSGCNIKGDDINAYIEKAIASTLAEESYYAKFDLSIETLISSNTGLVSGGAFETRKVSYEIIYNNGEHYSKCIDGDTQTEKWIYFDNDTKKSFTKIQKANEQDIITDEIFQAEESINILADLLVKYSSLEGKDIILRDGINRFGFDMLKIKVETLVLVNDSLPYRQKMTAKDGDEAEYKYIWSNIVEADKETINLTIKGDKITCFEIIRETVESRPRTTQLGGIGESHIGVTTELQEIEINIEYKAVSIPTR